MEQNLKDVEEVEDVREEKEKIALFGFRVIAELVGLRTQEWGKKEEILQEITQKECGIPHSGRSYIGRSAVLEWLKSYKGWRGKE